MPALPPSTHAIRTRHWESVWPGLKARRYPMHLQAEVGVGLEGKEQTGPSREEPGGEQKPLTDAQNNWVLPAERLYVRPRSCVTHLYTSRAVPHTLESAERNTGPLARAPGQSRGDISPCEEVPFPGQRLVTPICCSQTVGRRRTQNVSY